MNEHEIVEYILSLDEQLKKAYNIYQEYLVFNQIATLDIAEQWLNQLIDDYKASNITEYVPAWKLLENWHDEIINSFNRVNGYRISNGPMERVNESIKTIFRLSFGSRNVPFFMKEKRKQTNIKVNLAVLTIKTNKNNKNTI